MLNRTHQPPVKPISNISLPEIEKNSLGNGIPMHLIKDDKQDVVRIDFMFAGGVWHQSKSLIAFMTNQMLKEGTVNLSSQQIAEKLDYYGSWLQLSASYHYSYLTVYSLSKYVSETLAVVEEMLEQPLFPQTEFEVLLNKRKQQYLLDEQKVQSLASKKFSLCVYGPNHPNGKTASKEDFDKITTTDLRDFYHNYYGSRNMQIVLAGKIDEGLLSTLESLFGKEHVGKEQLPKEPQFEIQSDKEKFHFIPKADSVQSAIKVGRVGLQHNHADFHPMKVVTSILGGYFGSRLMTNIREEKGYTYGIGASLSASRDGGTFCISTETATAYVQPLIKELYKEMELLCNQTVGEEELQMVKNFMLGDAVRLFDGTFSIADILISLIANDLDISFYEKQIQTIRNITPQKIQTLAQKYFVKEEFYEIIAGKK